MHTLQEILSSTHYESPNPIGHIVIDDICYNAQEIDTNATALFYFLSFRYNKNYESEIEAALTRSVKVIILDATDLFYDAEEIQKLYGHRVPIVLVSQLYKKIGQIAAKFYNFPQEKLRFIGVTGTNGKTSVSYLTAQCLSKLGARTAVVGTLGQGIIGETLFTESSTGYRNGYTTPSAIKLYKILSEFVNNKVELVVLEATSEALLWGTLQGITFESSIFTNFTEDHLEYHGNLFPYAEAKRILFDEKFFPSTKSYIINYDNLFGKALIKTLDPKKVLAYSKTNPQSALYAHSIKVDLSGTNFEISYRTTSYAIKSKALGSFNIDNILAVFGCLCSLGFEEQSIARILSSLDPVPGRMEHITKPGSASVIVDFAHNPDGVDKVLDSLKKMCTGRLFCVFGCPGGTDNSYRRHMSEAVQNYADVIIVTSSNPYQEDPQAIVHDVHRWFTNHPNIHSIVDRKDAILYAIETASPKDIIAILGKGVQDHIIFSHKKIPHNDIHFVKSIFNPNSGLATKREFS